MVSSSFLLDSRGLLIRKGRSGIGELHVATHLSDDAERERESECVCVPPRVSLLFFLSFFLLLFHSAFLYDEWRDQAFLLSQSVFFLVRLISASLRCVFVLLSFSL